MSTGKVTFTFEGRPKQKEFFFTVAQSARRMLPFNKFALGGGVRGGKTFTVLFCLARLCHWFPGSKWVVIRKDFAKLQQTTIPSLQKLISGSSNWSWNRDKANYYAERSNGSRIYFYGENLDIDPEMNKFLGLECNGFFLEQSEELSERMYEMALQRAGSEYLPGGTPPPFIFFTFNPSQTWNKKMWHIPYLDGTLPEDMYYMPLLERDNPSVTNEQKANWKKMSDNDYKRMILGDWTDFDDTDGRWANAFDYDIHTRPKLRVLPNYPIHLGWDFNRDPLSCVAVQMSPAMGRPDSFLRWIKEFHEPVQLKDLCLKIKRTFPSHMLYVTGDSSGNKGDIGFEGRNDTHYKMIQRYLDLRDKQMHLNKSNLYHNDSRLLTNTMLTSYPNELFCQEGCPKLIGDYMTAKVDERSHKVGHILKDRGENKNDLLDASRYIRQTYFKKWFDSLGI